MEVGIIATDYGEHSAEKLAAHCAARLIQFNMAAMDGDRVLIARQFEMRLIEALIAHHSDAQIETRSALIANSAEHFAKPLAELHHPGDRLERAIEDVIACADGTPWTDDMRKPESIDRMHAIIGQYLVDTQHLERLYHADRTPDDQAAKDYKARDTGVLILGEGV